jgi:hypothetical protein
MNRTTIAKFKGKNFGEQEVGIGGGICKWDTVRNVLTCLRKEGVKFFSNFIRISNYFVWGSEGGYF